MKLFNPKSWDFLLVGSALLLSVIGILLIYSAKYSAVSVTEKELYIRQIMWLGLAILVFLLTKEIPLKLHEALAYFYYGLGVFLLLSLLAFGATKMGATRWFALGNFNLQPGEIMKIAMIMALARYLVYAKRSPHNFTWVIISALFALLPMGLVLNQPDLGTSMVFIVLLLSMLFWAGLPYYYLLLLLTPIVSLITAFHWISWGVFFVTPALARNAKEALHTGRVSKIRDLVDGDLEQITGREVTEAAHAGDALAREILERAGFYIGLGIVNLLHHFDTQLFVLGGSIAMHAWDFLYPPILATLDKHAMPSMRQDVRVVRTELGDDVGLLGAVVLVADETGQ